MHACPPSRRQPFNIEECEGCEIMLLDNSDTIQIDYCKDCKIFIGEATGLPRWCLLPRI